MKYKKFIIENYRAIENAVTIDIERDKIVPLIGANESGKTTILQAVYAFDYANDKEFEGRHLKNLRNFYNPKHKEDAQVSAVINIKKEEFLNCISNDQLRNKYSSIEDFTEIKITRNLIKLKYEVSIIENEDDANLIGRELVSRLSYIIYNDDFIERPKNEIDILPDQTELFGWLGIYEMAFKKAGYSIFELIKETDNNIKLGILSDVEEEINNTLVKEWGKISLEKSNCLSIKLTLNKKENKNVLGIQIKENKGKQDRFFNIEERSKGFLWFFNFVMKIKYNPKSTGSNNDIIYLLDEPGSYLHPSAQEKLCKMIKNISNRDGKVIYCTHTHHLLDPKYIPPKYIYLVEKNKDKEIKINKITDLKTKTKKTSELQPVYEALGIADWDFFAQSQKIILVEGIHDKYAIEKFCDNLDGYVILPGVNAESIYNNIPKMIAYDKKYISIWDNDDEGIKYYEKSKKAFGKIEEKKMFTLPNLYNKNKVRMEEMFNDDDFSNLSEILQLNKNSSYSSIMTALVTSNDETIEKCKKTISEKTKKNFDELYSIITSVYKN